MKALIIGYGSIGKRHEEVLKSLGKFEDIHIVSKQNIIHTLSYKKLEDVTVSNLEVYDYFLISSETFKHTEQIEFLEGKVKQKKIFCEKPLAESYFDVEVVNNKLNVGYVLRFHPLLQKLKIELKSEIIFSLNVHCGQYLPLWRPDRDYRDSYSSSLEAGGGVLLDLSHELDYVYWLCGEIEKFVSIVKKASNLEIKSDDVAQILGLTMKGGVINISVNYLDKKPQRKLTVNTEFHTYIVDLIKNSYLKYDSDGLLIEELNLTMKRNDMFNDMHKDILNDGGYCSDLEQGKYIMKLIDNVRSNSL